MNALLERAEDRRKADRITRVNLALKKAGIPLRVVR